MVVSKAARAQRARRKKEFKSKAVDPQPFKDRLPWLTHSQQNSIQEKIHPSLRNTSSDVMILVDNDECPQELPTIVEEQDENLIFKS